MLAKRQKQKEMKGRKEESDIDSRERGEKESERGERKRVREEREIQYLDQEGQERVRERLGKERK